MFDKKTLSIYAFIVGAFFIISGVGKVIDTAAFSQLITQYGLGIFKMISPLIVLIEILIGLFLIFSIYPKRYSFISFVLLVIFTISFAYAYFERGITNCGCFGTLKYSSLSPAFSFIRNFILIFLSFIVWIKYPKEKTETENWKIYFILGVMCLAIFVAGYTFRIPIFTKPNKINERYLNKPLGETELSKYVTTSKDSTYLVFCFSYTCPHCLNSIENLKQYEKSKTVDRIIAIASGEEKDKLAFNRNFDIDFFVQHLPSETMSTLVNGVPTAFFIKQDTIFAIIPSALPSYVLFKKFYSPKDTSNQ